jgi:hypothetical protein
MKKAQTAMRALRLDRRSRPVISRFGALVSRARYLDESA